MWDFYQQLWRPFGELLTDMERLGVKVDVAHLQRMEQKALADRTQAETRFKEWAKKFCADVVYMNIGSGAVRTTSLSALFFPRWIQSFPSLVLCCRLIVLSKSR